MDHANNPPSAIAEEDKDLPTGPIVLPEDPMSTPAEPEVTEKPVSATEPTDVLPPDDLPVAATIPAIPQVADDPTKSVSVMQRMMDLKDDGIRWFKEHKFLGGILLLLTFGILLYFWPLITCALVTQHMLKNTSGTANKMQMYKIVAVLLVIAISIQAIWIVQLAQASSFH